MIEQGISGGQTGSDQGGLRAFRASRIATGGWVPLGWKTDAGPAPWLADFGCRQHSSSQYGPRTVANVRMSTCVIWFGNPDSPGGKLTLTVAACDGIPTIKIPFPAVVPGAFDVVRTFLRYSDGLWRPSARIVMVAGNRERTNVGIGDYTEQTLILALAERE